MGMLFAGNIFYISRLARTIGLSVICMGCVQAGELQTLTSPTIATKRPLGLLDVIQLTLVKNSDIELHAKLAESGLGALQQATGQFDSKVGVSLGESVNNIPLGQSARSSYAQLGFPLSSLSTTTNSANLSLSTPFRNGVVLNSTVASIRTTGTSNDVVLLPSQSVGTVNFNIFVPLLKGSGDAASANESAAKLEWDARTQDLRFSISQSVLNTVTAYWSLIASSKILDIANESESSGRRMMEQTQKLIDADELPAADINVLKADLMDRTSVRITAEQNLLDAQLALGQAIGLQYQQITTLKPADGFPTLETEIFTLEKKLESMIAQGIARRSDHVAAKLRQDAAKILLDAAQNNRKPQVDINLSVGYAGLVEDAGYNNSGDLSQNRTGLNKSALISYQWPFDNNSARGLLQQQLANFDQSSINVSIVERSISVGVKSALSNLLSSALKLKKSEEAVRLYKLTLENEKNKHKLGRNTLIEVLTTNDRYINASINNISFQLNYLNALVQLLFQSGSLVEDDKTGQTVRIDKLISVAKYN
jgi:outer membrane protein TolC